MRRLNSKIRTKFISEKGNDSIHKTYMAYTPLSNFLCIAVAESYDNEEDINSARLAVETVLTSFEQMPSLKKGKIKQYLKKADEQLKLHSTKHKLKTSITIIVSDYMRMRYAVCGNTKIHIFHENQIILKSKTQTIHEERIEGELESESDFQQIHNLDQYLGQEKSLNPYISKKTNLMEGSSIVITTSNLWSQIDDIELLDAYEAAKDSDELLDSIQELMLSRQEKVTLGSYTAAAIFVEKAYIEGNIKRKKIRKYIIIGFSILIIVILILFLYIYTIRSSDRKKMVTVEKYLTSGSKYAGLGNYSKSLEEYEKAYEAAEKLSITNWQYKEKKQELVTWATDKFTLFVTLQDAEICLTNENYTEAKKLYHEVKKQTEYEEETSLIEYAEEKINWIDNKLETAQIISMGEVYEISGDYDTALLYYNSALELLKRAKDLDLLKEIQLKIYDIHSLQKNLESAANEANSQEAQDIAEMQIIKIRALLNSANKFLVDGNLEEAERIWKECMAIYQQIQITNDEVKKIYEEIVTLELSISEGKIKKEKEELDEKLQLAAEYMLSAAEEGRSDNIDTAIKLYEKALGIYVKLKLWDEQVEKIFDAIFQLEQRKEELEAAAALAAVNQAKEEKETKQKEDAKEEVDTDTGETDTEKMDTGKVLEQEGDS